jgi:tetratricopeptide (TPR) repeat protein
MNRLNKIAIVAAGVFISIPVLRADTLWIGTDKNSIKVDGLKVVDVTGDRLKYLSDTGMNASKPLSQLPQINIDGEISFNAAENAFAARDYDTAITNYQNILQSSSAKPWMQARAATRLLEAGKIKNRFDAQVDAYIALLQKDPAAAAHNKPAEPAEHSPYLDTALASISKALEDAKLQDSQKSALLGLQLKIDRMKGDSAAVNSTLQQMVALGSASDSDKALLKIMSATVAYDSKQYDQAVNDIEQNRALFTEPDQQVDALFVVAQAKQKLNGDKPDPDVQKDVALNYLRVVTFGSQLPDRPHVAESLYMAGQIEDEKLKDPQAALSLYKQLVNDRAYAGSPFVDKAKAAMEVASKKAGGAK